MCRLEKIIVLILVVTIVTCQNEPPQIISRFKDMYYVVEKKQEKLTFTCSATGTPKPRYEWYKDGNKVQNSSQVTVDETTGNLSILATELTYFGKYQCHAINSMGTALSVQFELERTFIGMFTDQVQKDLEPVQEYKTVSLQCTGKPECVPATVCKVEWKRGEGTTYTVQEDDRIAIDADGTLHFLNVLKSDESSPSVPYACGIHNEMMKAFYKGANVIMPVTEVTNPKQFKPMVKFATQYVKGLKDGQAELQCVFSGYHLPDIEWYTPNDQLITASTKYSFPNGLVRRNLVIKQLSQNDEGTYRCVGINMLGKVETHVYLNVTSKPTFLNKEDQLESKTIPIGDKVIFTCRMSSLKGERQPSAPTWRKNGVLLPESQNDKKYLFSDDMTELTITDVQKPEDTSTIMCVTGNVIFDMNGDDKYVKSYASAILRVIDPIQVIVKSPLKIELNDTVAFSMAILVTRDPSIPQLNLMWSLIRYDDIIYRHEQLKKLSFISFNDDQTNLTIFPSAKPYFDTSVSDSYIISAVLGNYTVKIYHPYQSVYRTFEVYTMLNTLDIDPKTPDSTSYLLWIIGGILGVTVLALALITAWKWEKKLSIEPTSSGQAYRSDLPQNLRDDDSMTYMYSRTGQQYEYIDDLGENEQASGLNRTIVTQDLDHNNVITPQMQDGNYDCPDSLVDTGKYILHEQTTVKVLHLQITSQSYERLNTADIQSDVYTSPYSQLQRDYQALNKNEFHSAVVYKNHSVNEQKEVKVSDLKKTSPSYERLNTADIQSDVYISPYSQLQREYQALNKNDIQSAIVYENHSVNEQTEDKVSGLKKTSPSCERLNTADIQSDVNTSPNSQLQRDYQALYLNEFPSDVVYENHSVNEQTKVNV